MIDFHTHSLLSDGDLLPSELARRAAVAGCRALGISDHVDASNADFVVPRLLAVCGELGGAAGIEVFAGVEVTHVPPPLIGRIVERCRGLGAEFVIVHGETPAEPVQAGTNAAAIDAGADILSHPGLISSDEARAAAARGVHLEISCRAGHCLANGHVARAGAAAGALLLIGSDAHAPSDLVGRERAARVARGAGLGEEEVAAAFRNAEALLRAIRGRRGHVAT
ncbi:MAG: histidinol phosphate phosphatase domain-containing protein [bacterium]|nr:histidinol phosphate phosphatase domain-containing protein [bacterium]